MQVEYATDLVFKRPEDLRALYESLVRTAVHTVKPEQVATFLGRKLTANYQGELGHDFHTRIEGTRIKHHMGRAPSRCTTSWRGCCASRLPPTMSPSSDTTAGWNTATAAGR